MSECHRQGAGDEYLDRAQVARLVFKRGLVDHDYVQTGVQVTLDQLTDILGKIEVRWPSWRVLEARQ